MDRRKFLTGVGLGALGLALPKLAGGQEPPSNPQVGRAYGRIRGVGYGDQIAEIVPGSEGDQVQTSSHGRVITLNSPAAKYIRGTKGGMQVGVVYWADLDTRQYRRVALWVDFANGGPWEGGGRIVRHPRQAGMKKIVYGSLHQDDLCLAMRPVPEDPKEWSYPIDHYPVVSYESYHSRLDYQGANCRTTPLSVEGVFDEIQISSKAPEEILALYPDLPRYTPKFSTTDRL